MVFLFTNCQPNFNRGTVVLPITAKSVLSKSFPGAKFFIYIPFDDEYRQWYEGMTIVELPYIRVRKASRWVARFRVITTILRLATWFFFTRLFGVEPTILLNRPDLKALHECDIVIDLGGDTVSEEYGWNTLLLHFLPLLSASLFRKPVVAYSQSMGPFRRWKWLAKPLFKIFDLIILREKASIETLKSVNYQGPFQCTADTGFCLETASENRIREIATQEKFGLSKPYVVLNVSPMTSFFYQKLSPRAKFSCYYKVMASAIDKIIEAADRDCLLVAHVTGGNSEVDDRFSAREVVESCKHSARIHCVQGEYSPSEIKGIISHADAMVGARMHANIAALSSFVPTIAVSYSQKFSGIMALCGQEKWVLSIHELDNEELFEMFTRLWEARTEIKRDLAERIPEVERLAASNGKILAHWYKAYTKANRHRNQYHTRLKS